MRLLLAVVFAALLGVQAQRVQDVPPADRAAVEAVIRAQIEAFKKDDAAQAYSYAAPSIKRVFASPAVFIEMVKTGYAVIYRPLSYTFGKATRAGAQVVQEVRLVGLDGRQALAVYLMERQPDGSWKIAGVQVQDQPGQTAKA